MFSLGRRAMHQFFACCRLCPNSTGADIRSVCTEAGMYAIRARRKTVTEKDFLDAVQKVGCSPCMIITVFPPTLRFGVCMCCIPPAHKLQCIRKQLYSQIYNFLQVIKGFAKFSATPAYMVRVIIRAFPRLAIIQIYALIRCGEHKFCMPSCVGCVLIVCTLFFAGVQLISVI